MRTAILFLALSPALAFAQNLHTVDFYGQPLVYMRDGAPHGCGVRIIGGQLPIDEKSSIKMLDVSANLYPKTGALVKMSTYDTSAAGMKAKVKPQLFHINTGWIRAVGAKATTQSRGDAVKGDDGFAILYGTDADSILAIFKAVMTDQVVQVGIRRQGEPTETIFSGKVALSAAEREQLQACFSEISR